MPTGTNLKQQTVPLEALAEWLQPLLVQASLPQNRQLYRALRELILQGRLQGGQRLPSSRQLATAMQIARNTVLYAFEQLQAEGYVLTRHGAGSYVAETLPDPSPQGEVTTPVENAAGGPYLSRRVQQVLGGMQMRGFMRERTPAFLPGVPELAQFPHLLWQRIWQRQQRQMPRDWLGYTRAGGHQGLKQVLSDYLRLTRALNCSPEQILITSGTQQSLDLLARALADPGDVAWMEEPGYGGASAALTAAELALCPVPVDDEGLCWERGDYPVPRLIYVTPSHQYPLGCVMSLSRRRSLLQYAAQQQSWILEDDYDSEFRYDGAPLAALQGLDRAQRVIYMGTLSKACYPGLRLAYLVLPPVLVEPLTRLQARLLREPDYVKQATLAEFIAEGHLASHIRRMRQLYAARQQLLRDSIADGLEAEAALLGGQGGLHVVCPLPVGSKERPLMQQLQQRQVQTPPLGSFHLATPQQSGLVLGYAGVHENDIRRAGRILGQQLRVFTADPEQS